jgi:hypothetical protein
MIRFINQLESRRKRDQSVPWEYLREAFATWQRVAFAKDSARRAADHERHIRLCLLSSTAWRRYVRRQQRCIP